MITPPWHRYRRRYPLPRRPRHPRWRLLFWLLLIFSCLALASLTWAAANTDGSGKITDQTYLVLCYHSVPVTANGGSGANSVTNFAGQLAWLRHNGYQAISMDDVLKARTGDIRLPPKSYLLTVDDGYEDFYRNVFPLIKLYRIPVVFGLVGRWIEEGRDLQLSLTDPGYASQHFVTWQQVREMSESGLVEMASHSYDLHHGILANPQRNMQPAAVTQEYDPDKQSYETAEQRRVRIRADLRKNSDLIALHTGKRPRIMVWPYGAMDRIAAEEANAAGMPINFTLADGLASTGDTEVVARNLIDTEESLGNFTYMIAHSNQRYADPVRAIKINLDRIYDPNPMQEDEKLGRLLDQILQLGVNTVLLQPFSATPGSRYLSSAYFPNSVLPVRSDLLNRVAWQFHNRSNVDVFMLIEPQRIARTESGILHPLDMNDAEDREYLLSLYSELSLVSETQGLMFDDTQTGPALFDFNAALLGRAGYIRPPLLFYSANDGASANLLIQLDGAQEARPDRIAIPAPLNASAMQLSQFLQQLPPGRVSILNLPVTHTNLAGMHNITEQIGRLQRRGMEDFILDGDAFMDDPAQFDMMRKTISLKNNPSLNLEK